MQKLFSAAPASPRYLLCAGAARSGTTALRLSLGLHPSIYYEGQENYLLNGILHTAWRNFTLPKNKLAMILDQTEYDRTFEQLFNTLFCPQRDKQRNKILMAACDLRDDVIDYLCQVLPNIKIVYLIRNGIEVVASRTLFEPLQDASFEDHCNAWLRAGRIARWGQNKSHQIRFLRYEWFQDSQRLRAEFESLFEWMKVPWHDAPLQNLLTKRYHPTQHPNEMQDVAKDSKAARKERWHYWSEAERAYFDAKCGQAMLELGYALPWRVQAAQAEGKVNADGAA